MAAALRPCSTRPRISMAGDDAKPQITDVSPKPVTPKRKILRRPKRSPSRPPVIRNTA
ncbi:conserved hypothetical protein [Ricinus communis]|uniref:Uncharacterized protein n=1 Tax=Ricinus communis TaxID=3988 RepID=B9TBD8_RICCO|nr:conserved hypothetical protein [Ricinus communis]